MWKIFGILTTCCLVTSCASMMAHSVGMTQEDRAYKIIPKNFGENRAVAVFYGYEYLKEKEDRNAETTMREPNYENIPEFGYISVRTQAWTASAGNQGNWLFIVQDKNKNEIYRSNGSDSMPRGSINDMGTYYNTTWWGIHIIPFAKSVDFPLYLRVVTAFDETAIDIVIEKK